MRMRRVAAALALAGITGITVAAGRDDHDDRDGNRNQVGNVAVTPAFLFQIVSIAPTDQRQFLSCVVTNLSTQPRQIRIEFVHDDGQAGLPDSPTVAPGATATTFGAAPSNSSTLRCVFTVLNGTKRDIIAQGTLTTFNSPNSIGGTYVLPAQ